ncbi:MAG TPA: TldD/PmbA family protein, partial [Gemmatimonadaceae bacterium]|nr:TldD/PmbA family protein [Gemmatimonadaceae bacterium]
MTKSLFRAADVDFLSREQAKALCDRVLSFAKADETRVNITSGWSGNTRFAGNEITTSGGTTDTNVTVTSTIGRRRASAETNILDDESLKRTVAFAEQLAKLSPEDPELMPELGRQQYATVDAFFDASANLNPEVRAAATKSSITSAEQTGRSAGAIFVAGFLSAIAGAAAVATSRGLFAYHRNSEADLSLTAR